MKMIGSMTYIWFIQVSGYSYIRFNPDQYTIKGKKFNQKLSTRLPKLIQMIQQQMKRVENEENQDLIETHYLFFDEE